MSDETPVATNGIPRAINSHVPQIDISELMTRLAAVGIAVDSGAENGEPVVSAATPESPMRLLEAGLINLVAEIESGGGVTGAELDALAPMPEGAPPFSYLPAAWLDRADTEEADLARELMGVDDDTDWSHAEDIVFPQAVLLLFVSNIARASAEESGVENGPVPLGPPTLMIATSGPSSGLAAGVCSGLTGWVDNVLNKLFQSLHLEDSILPTFLEDIWNWAVDLAETVVQGVADALLLPIAAVETVLKTAIAVVGTLSLVTSLMQEWSVTVEFGPAVTHSPHPGEAPANGSATAHIESGSSSGLRSMITDCANDAGIPLPSTEPAGKTITWHPSRLALRELMSIVEKPTTIGPDNTAVLTFLVIPEQPKDSEEPTSVHNGYQYVRAEVERFSAEEGQKLIDELVFSGSAGVALELALGGVANSVKARIAALAKKARGTSASPLRVDYHVSDEERPSTTTSVPPLACPFGVWESVEYAFPDYAVLEGGTGVHLTVSQDNTGTIDFTGSDPVMLTVPGAEPPTLTLVEVDDQASFTLEPGSLSSQWNITSVTGNYSVTVSINIGDGFVEVGGDQGAGTFTELDGAYIECLEDGTLHWNHAGGVSWYEFQPSDQ